jgi:hypothetical protein
MSYFGIPLRSGLPLGLSTIPTLTATPLSYRLAPSLDLSFAGSDALSPAITFSRTTNATVTGSNGLIQNAPMNLLTFSEQFDNAAWNKARATVTANITVAPNGTTTADKIIATSASGSHYVNQGNALLSRVAVSVFAKAAEYSVLQIAAAITADQFANFDLAGGVLGSVGPDATNASITAVGNGWYLCQCSFAATSTLGAIFAIAPLTTSGWLPSFVGNDASGLFLWGAQLELGSTATTYNPTTVKNLLGFTENFDNAAWTKSNAFVQTNLFSYSSDFSDSSWSKGTATITNAATIAPDGTQTASLEVLAAGTTA